LLVKPELKIGIKKLLIVLPSAPLVAILLLAGGLSNILSQISQVKSENYLLQNCM